MARTEAMDRAIKKYEKEKIDKVLLRLPKGAKAEFQEYAKSIGLSLNAFLYHAALEAMYRDQHSGE